jgi:hypothetical protein
MLALMLTLLASCSKEEEQTATDGHTVVLFFPWTDNLYTALLENIADIKEAMAAHPSNTRVLLILATSSNSGRMSELACNNGTCSETVLKTYTSWSFTQKDNIRSMFNDAAAYVNASSYSMIIGAHGSGWLPKQSYPNKHKAFGGTSTATKINIETLDSAIVESGLRHLEYLCFDDCYMANIETAYRLRNATDHLIASTSEIMAHGMPYSDVWTYLSSATPDYQGIVSGFYNFYSSYRMPYGALSVTDCTQLDLAASAMKQLNMLMTQYGLQPSDFSPQMLDGFTYNVFFDMKSYTDLVCEALQAKGVDTSTLAINTLYSSIITAHCCTPCLYSDYSTATNKTFAVSSNCGITISDPSVNNEVTPYMESTAWYEATH